MREDFLVRVAILLLVYPFFLIQTEKQPADNLSILNNMTLAVTQRIVNELSPDSSAAIFVRSQSQNQAGNWLIENWLVKSFYQKGISKIYLEKPDSIDAFEIQFQIDKLGVEYLPIDTKNLVERRLKLSLAVRALEGSSGLIKLFQEFREQYTDSVRIVDVTRLENRDFSFTQSELPTQQGLKRFFEPLMIMTTTAAVVYLFFRLRSK